MIKNALIFLILAVSCNSSKVSSEQNNLSFDIILEHAIGGKTTKNIVVVSDQKVLEDIYKHINLNQEPDYLLPEINFKTEQIVVFFMGEKNSGGYSISIKDLEESKNHINLSYQENSPKPTDMVTMAITQPYCIVKIKKPSKELKIIKVD